MSMFLGRRPTLGAGTQEPVTFESIRLKGTNKKGILTPDADGCYTMCVGGLNAHNHAEAFYVYEEAKHFFQNDSSFMRKIERGVIRGEYGHPKREPGMSMADFGERLMRIEETLVCCTFRKIWLEHNLLKDNKGRPIVAIMAKIFPSGPYGEVLRKQLESAGEQCCFSIRSFTEDFFRHGKRMKILRQLITFDYVNEPGMFNAEKLLSPSLESIQETRFTKSELLQAAQNQLTHGYGMESLLVTPDELRRHLNVKRRDYKLNHWL